ncbi:uncharacterized protein METZ01_LOCUS457930, partial [marine metagenome]
AKTVLASVDLVAAEDTRVTARLLSHLGIKVPQTALHEHNEKNKTAELIKTLKSGNSVALVSDAGTPLISDPGFRLIKSAHEEGITVSPIPGPSALIAAVSSSGLPTNRFVFEGFLPARNEARKKRLQNLKHERRTIVFFESVHRITEMIGDMIVVLGGDRNAAIGRELTKLHEQCLAADLNTLAEGLASGSIPEKGEFVIVVEGSSADSPQGIEVDLLFHELVDALPGKQAVDIVARVTGLKRNDLYKKMLE